MTRSLFVAVLLVGAGLTGCLSKPDAETAVQAVNQTDVSTVPPDGRDGKLIAFEETNKTVNGTVDGVDHHHDYWAGNTRVLLFEETQQMVPMGSGDAAEYQATSTFRPPQGKWIYEQTGSVEVTITNPQRHVCEGEFTLGGYFVCTSNTDYHLTGPSLGTVPDPAGGPAGLKLRYKHASTTQWTDVGDIGWDAPAIIKVTVPTQTDMPHVTSSSWEFQVASPNKEDGTLVFDVKVEIVRGEGDVPLWPGHPDFYADSSQRVVLDKTDAVACDTAGCTLVEDSGLIPADRLVSYGTKTIHVWVNITDFQSTNPVTKPDNWFLYHRNSTGQDNATDTFDKENHGVDVMEHYWALPVDDNGMDSPYADGSKWVFALGAALFKEGLSCYGGCAEWSATYTIKVIATNVELAPEEYEMFCIRDDDWCGEPSA